MRVTLWLLLLGLGNPAVASLTGCQHELLQLSFILSRNLVNLLTALGFSFTTSASLDAKLIG